MDIPLSPQLFSRLDEGDDAVFYSEPRLVRHIDDTACASLTAFLDTVLSPGSNVLDLMSSYASHLPKDKKFASVIGLGMNQVELDENPQLTDSVVQNLAINTRLPFDDGAFQSCLLTVSVQYLVHPIAVFHEIARVLSPGSPCIVSFSNRCFPTKAVAIWHRLTSTGHAKLVSHYFNITGKFGPCTVQEMSPEKGQGDPLFVISANTL